MSSSADERRPIFTVGQILLLILAPATILFLHAAAFLTMRYVRSVDAESSAAVLLLTTTLHPVTDFYGVLWVKEAGVQMLAATWLLVPIGELILVVHFIICNRLRATWRNSLLVVVTLLVLTTCFAPAVLVLLVGPPIAEQIYKQRD